MSLTVERWESLQNRLKAACDRAGRDHEDVTMIAVSKMHPASAVHEAWRAGARLFGESYVQEWIGKSEHPQLVAAEGLRWSFIGHLQRNKVRHLIGRVSCIETVDSLRLAQEISRRASTRASSFRQSVLLQVNLTSEIGKRGFGPEELKASFNDLISLPGLSIDGLMHIPPPRLTAEESRPDHRALETLRNELKAASGLALRELSMGMSADFEVAIEEGSTRVRVGTALFGPRPT